MLPWLDIVAEFGTECLYRTIAFALYYFKEIWICTCFLRTIYVLTYICWILLVCFWAYKMAFMRELLLPRLKYLLCSWRTAWPSGCFCLPVLWGLSLSQSGQERKVAEGWGQGGLGETLWNTASKEKWRTRRKKQKVCYGAGAFPASGWRWVMGWGWCGGLQNWAETETDLLCHKLSEMPWERKKGSWEREQQ